MKKNKPFMHTSNTWTGKFLNILITKVEKVSFSIHSFHTLKSPSKQFARRKKRQHFSEKVPVTTKSQNVHISKLTKFLIRKPAFQYNGLQKLKWDNFFLKLMHLISDWWQSPLKSVVRKHKKRLLIIWNNHKENVNYLYWCAKDEWRRSKKLLHR